MKLEDKIKAFVAQMTAGDNTKVGMSIVPQLNNGRLQFVVFKMVPFVNYNGNQYHGVLPTVMNAGQICLEVDDLKQLKDYLNGLEF